MTVKYIRDTYGVPVQRGGLVRQRGESDEMVVTSCTHYVRARRLFSPRVHLYHPLDLEYHTGDGWFVPERATATAAATDTAPPEPLSGPPRPAEPSL